MRQLVEQLDDVGGVDHRRVTAGLRVALAVAAAAEIGGDHPPLPGMPLGQRFEVAGVAGEAVEAQDRAGDRRDRRNRDNGASARRGWSNSYRSTASFAVSPSDAAPLSPRDAGCAILPPRPEDPRAWRRVSTMRSMQPDFPRCTPRFLNRRAAASVGLAELTRTNGPGTCADSSRCRQSRAAARAALPRPPVPRVQPRPRRRPRLPVRAAARRARAPARPRHQGIGPDPVEPRRRRAADPQRRGARSPRHRDARSAGRQHLEELCLVRDRRGTGSRRRAVADPIGGAYPAEPRPHPHRQLPAPRLQPRHQTRSTSWSAIASSICSAKRPSTTRPTTRSGCSPWPSEATAGLAASYMAAGFVHGVLNSDNINITGESFDYGPWRFTPHWDGDFTAAYFDHYGLYAFGRQPEAIHWDLAQLAGCLSLVAEVEKLSEHMSRLGRAVRQRADRALLRRLGVESLNEQADRDLAAALVAALESRAVTIDRLFFDWRGGRDPGAETYAAEPFRALAAQAGRAGARAEPRILARCRSPARCISKRSRRSGRDCRATTTGRRSTPRSPRSGAWAKRCRTRLDRAGGSWWRAVNAEHADVLRARDRRRAVVGDTRRCARRGCGRPRSSARVGASFGLLPVRSAAPLRQRRAQERGGIRHPDRARDRQAPVGSQDRGRGGDQQGRHLDPRLCRADAQADDRGGDGKQGVGPPQAAWRARRARPL